MYTHTNNFTIDILTGHCSRGANTRGWSGIDGGWWWYTTVFGWGVHFSFFYLGRPRSNRTAAGRRHSGRNADRTCCCCQRQRRRRRRRRTAPSRPSECGRRSVGPSTTWRIFRRRRRRRTGKRTVDRLTGKRVPLCECVCVCARDDTGRRLWHPGRANSGMCGALSGASGD